MHACSVSSWTVNNNVINIKHSVSDVQSFLNKRSSFSFYLSLITELNVDLLEKRISMKSCEALNSYSKENTDDVLIIILTQILEEMNFNNKSDASEIKNAAHMKSDSLILISDMKTHTASIIKSDLRISESD